MIARINTLAKEKRQELVRFAKFCVVGISGTVIDFGLLNLFYNVLGVHQVLSNIVSVSAATVNNYTWSRFWVYPETRDQAGGRKFLQFIIVSIIALGLNTSILWATDQWILGETGLLRSPVASVVGWIGIEHKVFSSNAAKVIATGIVLFWNFFANRLWTFRDIDQVENRTPEAEQLSAG